MMFNICSSKNLPCKQIYFPKNLLAKLKEKKGAQKIPINYCPKGIFPTGPGVK